MRPEPFDACALVGSVAASGADLGNDKKLELIVDAPTGRILIVDDRDDVLDALASVVDELGF
jgi:hypothetical protein